MLSVIILTSHVPLAQVAAAVSRSLAALVPLAVDGLVRDVHILAALTSPELENLADDAGTDLHIEAGAALAAAKSRRIFIILAGGAVDARLADEIWQMGLLSDTASGARVYLAPETILQRLMPKNGGVIAAKADLARIMNFELTSIMSALKAPLKLKATLQR